MRLPRWTESDTLRMRQLYAEGHTAAEIGKVIGRTEGAVRNRCLRIGLAEKVRPWSDAEVEALKAAYAAARAGGPVGQAALADRFGRDHHNVSRKARELGLTNPRRPKALQMRLPLAGLERGSPEHRAQLAASTRATWQRRPHPRGMLGKKHTAETRAKMAAGWRRWWDSRTAEDEQARIEQMLATRVARHGRGSAVPREINYSYARRGRRPDLGNTFFRSAWEANYARYLNFLISIGNIRSWQYEPRTFVFPGRTRGVLSYTPDFLVVDTENGWERYHEIKGKWTDRFLQQLDLIERFYPEAEPLVIVDADDYRSLDRWARTRIPGWELERTA
jgi:hypothetical protein